jgi:hypothetical protein
LTAPGAPDPPLANVLITIGDRGRAEGYVLTEQEL